MYFVSLLIIEDGVVDSITGPFETAGEAMTWADLDAAIRQQEHPELGRESGEDLMMLADFNREDEPFGFIYQVIQATTPIIAQSVEPGS